MHPDSLTRKRCLYLLKRIIEDRIDSPDKIEIFQRIFLVLETVDYSYCTLYSFAKALLFFEKSADFFKLGEGLE